MDLVEIYAAETRTDWAAAREMIREYADLLGVDLCFQNLANEIETLETMYGAPRGIMLLVEQRGRNVGCVAVRGISADTCEMKRLYVRSQARGMGVGRALAVEAISRATALGYRRIVLDTLSNMTRARTLYQTLGFRRCAPYYENLLPGAIYLELAIDRDAGS
jgi:ribosomal protein S18 acetylase RimI-like enzyme